MFLIFVYWKALGKKPTITQQMVLFYMHFVPVMIVRLVDQTLLHENVVYVYATTVKWGVS